MITTTRDLLSDKRQLMAVYARMDKSDPDINFLLVSLSHWLRSCERLMDANRKLMDDKRKLMDANKMLAQEIMDQAEAMELVKAENRILTGSSPMESVAGIARMAKGAGIVGDEHD